MWQVQTKSSSLFFQILRDGCDYFINVGAVGQPRDNNPKAAYVIYDTDQQTVELRRVGYDIAFSQQKIRDAGL